MAFVITPQESETQEGLVYLVTRDFTDPNHPTISCECTGFYFNQYCKHLAMSKQANKLNQAQHYTPKN